MKKPQKPITPTEYRKVASEAHILILDGLASQTPWSVEDLSFQGGTSLALVFDSPRFSEDLDFIVREDLEFSKHMQKVRRHVEEGLQGNFPGSSVLMKVKEGEQQNVYTFAVELPFTLGKVKVKSEFWKVKDEYLKAYDHTYRQVVRRGNIELQIPAASLEQIFADKMVALGARERFKWRDAFDLWFLKEAQIDIFSTGESFVSWTEKTLSLYNTAPDALKDGWMQLYDMPNNELFELAEKDLKPFLSEELWKKLYPNHIQDMVLNMKQKLEEAMGLWPPVSYQGLTSEEFKDALHHKNKEQKEEKHGL